jgi:hypothetical protein
MIMTTAEIIQNYKAMQARMPNSSILREVQHQYRNMSEGGDGGPMGYTPPDLNHEPTCREYNYPGKTDDFFKEVRTALGWL